MSRRRYTEEFKVAAVRQITVEGHSVRGVAALKSRHREAWVGWDER